MFVRGVGYKEAKLIVFVVGMAMLQGSQIRHVCQKGMAVLQGSHMTCLSEGMAVL